MPGRQVTRLVIATLADGRVYDAEVPGDREIGP
jgi:hypothetical protein